MGRFIFIGCLLLAQLGLGADTAGPAAIAWQEWNPATFEKAKTGKKLIILDLHAGWCHWCHVMDKQTYGDAKVIDLIQSHYVAIGVDADSRPDLANRYEDYGWPATVIYDFNGRELAKRRGFIPPQAMISMLQAFIDDPTPGPSVEEEQKPQYPASGSLTEPRRKELERQLLANYDDKLGGWGIGGQKYLDWDNLEYCLLRAKAGDAKFAKMAAQTLAAQTNLIDPVWGGGYQYSTDGDWAHPHFEKIMQFQAENLRIYALAYADGRSAANLKSAGRIHKYVLDFLTDPEGAFYTSQDADLVDGEHAADYFKLNDTSRRKAGIPRVDTHIYARENGWMIDALVTFYSVTGEPAALDQALRAAKYMTQERGLPSGGWRHDASNDGGPYLGDTVYMGRALLSLYAATGRREFLYRAEDAAKFINDRFRVAGQAGLVTTAISDSPPVISKPQFEENVAVARLANLLSYYTDNKAYHDLAECAMRYISASEITRRRGASVGGILVADHEFTTQPLHIVVVGSKDDVAAQKLFDAAVRYPVVYKQVEWEDPTDEPLHKDVTYPPSAKAAAYICTNGACSAPIFKPEEVASRIAHLNAPLAAARP